MKTPKTIEQLESEFSFEALTCVTPSANQPKELLSFAVCKKSSRKVTRLSVAIHPGLVEEAGIEAGDYLRMDADTENKVAMLVVLAEKCSTGASRKIKIRPSGRGVWEVPFTGQISEQFPNASVRHELEVLAVAPSKIAFSIPENTAPTH